MDADDRHTEIEHKRALVQAYTKRQRALELQVAQFGSHTPPHIQIELDELRSTIETLEREIAALEGRAGDGAPQTSGGSIEAVPAAQRRGVALDLSHQQRKWSHFDIFVSQPEWQFQIINEGFLQQRAEIERCAALLVALPYHHVLSREEIDFIDAWVWAGGGLFVLGNYAADTHHGSNPSALARKFGLQFANDLILPAERSSEQDTRSQPRSLNADLAVKIQLAGDERHPILRGIREVAFLSTCSVEIIADPQGTAEYLLNALATSAVMQPRGPVDEDGSMPVIERWELARHAPAPLLAACQHGKGRVVVAGSRKLGTLDYQDNAALVRNVLTWLAEPGGIV
jgi:hypothetical protein